MQTHVRRRVAGMVLLAAGLAYLVGAKSTAADSATSVYKPVLPDAEFARLVADDAKIIHDALGNAGGDKKLASKAKTSALMIAVYAQGAMGKPGARTAELGGLRDTALKVAKAITDGNFNEAKKLADDLKPQGKPEPGAKPVVAVHEPFDTDILMQQFKPERGGGIDLEKSMQKLANKRQPYTPDEFKQAVHVCYRIAAIAQAAEAMAPAKDMGKKTRAEWIKLCQEMGKLALEAAQTAEASKPDDRKLKTTLRSLDNNCTNCHNTYRDN
jgi:cytochrome c556